jgi:hypothetical protein
MAISLTLDFPDAWVPRLVALYDVQVRGLQDIPRIQQLLVDLGLGSVDELTSRQKAMVCILWEQAQKLRRFEGKAAADQAEEAVEQDIDANFPLEAGDA